MLLTLPGVVRRVLKLLCHTPSLASTPAPTSKNPPAHPMVPALAAELLITLLQDDQPGSLSCWVPQV